MDLGEMHFANGRAFVLVTSGMTGPSPALLPSGGLHVVDIASQGAENRISLPSALTGRESRPSHASLDPEGKFLWVHNDGPSNDPGADSVFRVNVNPADIDADTGYLTAVEVVVGNGHQTGAFSRPSTYSALTRRAKKLAVIGSQVEQRLDVIDDDSTSATYGQVIKVVHHVGVAPHGMAYSTVSGHVYVGLTDGGMLILDTTSTALLTDADVDLANEVDASIKIIPAGTGVDQIPRAGYTHAAIDASDHDRVIKVLELGDVAVGSIDEKSGDKLYLPSTNAGLERHAILVVNIADPTSSTYLTVLQTITVGEAGEARDGEVSLNGLLAVYPDTCPTCKTVRVIDTATDRVIDILTLTGPASSTVGMVMVPFSSKDNH
jgi:DNA-binding beta-propeller fold protein YncE